MAIDNHIPLTDILNRKLAALTSSKQALSSGKLNQPLNAVFNQILSSFRARTPVLNGGRPTGLTAVDYLARAMPTQVFDKIISQRPSSNPAMTRSRSHISNSEPGNRINQRQTEVAALKSGKAAGAEKRSEKQSQQPKYLSENELIERSVKIAAEKYDLPLNLIKGVIKAESNFDADVVSSAGAQGLMQLMPGTARELGVSDPFDIEQNIDGGAHYLRKMLDTFNGNVRLALAAYNAGPGAVKKYDGNVPYQETRQYVKRVLRFSQRYA
jgi:soluble lytic murein transglycosylase-like protein